MKLLLDTCTFIWLVTGNRRLSQTARELFLDNENRVYLSAISAWEITLKQGKSGFPLPEGMHARGFVGEGRRRHGIESLPLDEEATFDVARLPNLHADPFDRMLIAQAVAHQMAILTPDPHIHRYPVAVRW